MVDCLRCGHASSLASDALPEHGLPTDVPLATLTLRLKCSACGSKAVSAVRYVEDDLGPPLVPV